MVPPLKPVSQADGQFLECPHLAQASRSTKEVVHACSHMYFCLSRALVSIWSTGPHLSHPAITEQVLTM